MRIRYLEEKNELGVYCKPDGSEYTAVELSELYYELALHHMNEKTNAELANKKLAIIRVAIAV